MSHVCNAVAPILCRLIWVSFPYMALWAAEPWTKQWCSYSDKETKTGPPGRKRFRFQSMEDTVGGLLQPIWPGRSNSWKAGSSVDPKLLLWNTNHRRELGTNWRTAQSAKEITTTIEAYVNGQINESMERCAFRSCVEQEGEMFDDFVVFLRELAKTCKFCNDDCTQKNIRDQIITGLPDGEAVEDLLIQS